MKTRLALSGERFPATGFHLDVLTRLAEDGGLEEATCLYTVSGASVCAGLCEYGVEMVYR